MRNRVVITSMGAITASGAGVNALWESVCNGKSAIEKLEGVGLSNYIGAQINIENIDEYGDIDRSIALALRAAEEAISNSGLSEGKIKSTHVFIGSSKGGIISLLRGLESLREFGQKGVRDDFLESVSHVAPADFIAERFGLGGSRQAIVSSCVSGIHSIILAARFIAAGRGEIALAGSAEASITPLMLAGYSSMGVLSKDTDNPECAMKPFDIKRDGFAIGEGAGMLVLESLDSALRRKAPVHAEILGWAYGSDTYEITSHNPDGIAIADQILLALDKADRKPSDIDYINAHGTATVQNDATEVKAIKHAFGDACGGMHISSTKPVTGHLIGAAGTVETIITVLAMQNSSTPPTMNLTEPDPSFGLNFTPLKPIEREIDCAMTMNYGFGGHIGVLILGRCS